MKVTIIGGTGLLGYHAMRELIKRGHKVSILALPPLPAVGLFPEDVSIHLRDLNQLADAEVADLLRDQDAVVFAAGVDDRVTPKPRLSLLSTSQRGNNHPHRADLTTGRRTAFYHSWLIFRLFSSHVAAS